MKTFDEIVSVYSAKTKGNGKAMACCPAHDDLTASLSISIGDNGGILFNCFAGCELRDILSSVGLIMADICPAKPIAKTKATCQELAAHKRLSADALRKCGVIDLPEGGIGIQYFNVDGSVAAVKARTKLVAKEGSFWPKGTPLIPYGLEELTEARKLGNLVLVEGESDRWTLRHHGINCLGIPGASSTKIIQKEHLSGLATLYVSHEPDDGGDTFVTGVVKRLKELNFEGQAFELAFGEEKDPSGLHMKDPAGFAVAFAKKIEQAQLIYASDKPLQSSICAADIKIKKVEWLWDGRLAIGAISVFDGDPGLGKSQTTISIISRLSRGEKLPGDSVTRAVSTSLLISYEDDPESIIKPRLIAAQADCSRIHVWNTSGVQCFIPDSIPEIEKDVLLHKARLVVIDPLMAALGSDVNAHRDQDIRRALSALNAMASRTGCAVLLVRHLNKTSGGKAMYRGGGSIGITAASRCGFLLSEDQEDKSRRVLASLKCNLGREPESLSMHIEEVRLQAFDVITSKAVWDGTHTDTADELLGDRSEMDRNREGVELIQKMIEAGPVPSKHILKALKEEGISNSQADRLKRKAGAISHRADGVHMWKKFSLLEGL